MKRIFNSSYFKKAMVAFMLSQPTVSSLSASTIKEYVSILNDREEIVSNKVKKAA